MVYCAVKNCLNKSTECMISFFELPDKATRPELHRVWVEQIELDEAYHCAPNSIYVCQDHFEYSCIEPPHEWNNQGCKLKIVKPQVLLTSDAVPTLFRKAPLVNGNCIEATLGDRKDGPLQKKDADVIYVTEEKCNCRTKQHRTIGMNTVNIQHTATSTQTNARMRIVTHASTQCEPEPKTNDTSTAGSVTMLERLLKNKSDVPCGTRASISNDPGGSGTKIIELIHPEVIEIPSPKGNETSSVPVSDDSQGMVKGKRSKSTKWHTTRIMGSDGDGKIELIKTNRMTNRVKRDHVEHIDTSSFRFSVDQKINLATPPRASAVSLPDPVAMAQDNDADYQPPSATELWDTLIAPTVSSESGTPTATFAKRMTLANTSSDQPAINEQDFTRYILPTSIVTVANSTSGCFNLNPRNSPASESEAENTETFPLGESVTIKQEPIDYDDYGDTDTIAEVNQNHRSFTWDDDGTDCNDSQESSSQAQESTIAIKTEPSEEITIPTTGVFSDIKPDKVQSMVIHTGGVMKLVSLENVAKTEVTTDTVDSDTVSCKEIGEVGDKNSESKEDSFDNLFQLDNSYDFNDANITHECPQCGYEPNSATDLATHLEQHNKIPLHTCEVCKIGFYHNSLLQTHLRKHVDIESNVDMDFKCVECGHHAVNLDELRTHAQGHTQFVHQCAECGHVAGNLIDSLAHSKLHIGGYALKCKSCEYIAKDLADLQRHEKEEQHTHDTNINRERLKTISDKTKELLKSKINFDAIFCNTGTYRKNIDKTKTMLKTKNTHKALELEHDKTVVKKPQPQKKFTNVLFEYKCPYCDFVAINSAGLSMHKKIHERHYCRDCDYIAKSADALHTHSLEHEETVKLKCTQCGYNADTLDQLRTHVRQHIDIDGVVHICVPCNIAYGSSGLLDNHMKQHFKNTGGATPYRCLVCPASFKYNDILMLHMSSHRAEGPYECRICRVGFSDKHLLDAHMHTHKSHFCPVCELGFTYKRQLNTHLSNVHPTCNIFKCMISEVGLVAGKTPVHRECEFMATSQEELNKHQYTHKPFHCADCGQAFLSRKSLNEHVSIAHKHAYRRRDYKNIHIPESEQKRSRTISSVRHANVYTGAKDYSGSTPVKRKLPSYKSPNRLSLEPYVKKQIICETCDHVAVSVNALRQHVTTNHENLKCSLCDYVGLSQRDVTKHTEVHRSSQKDASCSTKSLQKILKKRKRRMKKRAKKIKPFRLQRSVCQLCDYTAYASTTELQDHLKLHSGHVTSHATDSPYACTFCAVSCRGEIDLRQHLDTHSGEKMYKCRECSYTCSRLYALSIHMYAHNPQTKPHKCQYCGHAFLRKENLTEHTRTVHVNDNQFKCDKCPYTCKTKLTIDTHAEAHRVNCSRKCPECTFSCASKRGLTMHIWHHNACKILKCSRCQFTCLKESDLCQHFWYCDILKEVKIEIVNCCPRVDT